MTEHIEFDRRGKRVRPGGREAYNFAGCRCEECVTAESRRREEARKKK
ncbi:hypothetical protein VD659_16180 [Herbiconiux sp. 11R-BC]